MKAIDCLGTFVKKSREKERRRTYRTFRTGVKFGITALIWYFSWFAVVAIAALFLKTMNGALVVFGGAIAWFVILYALLSLLLWWGEKFLLPKRGIRF